MLRSVGRTSIVGLIALCAGSGCVVGPNYEPPPTQVLSQWRIAEAELSAGIDAGLPPEPVAWWHQFNDPILVALIVKALGDNFESQEAIGRILESRARLQVVAGQRLPLVDFTGRYRRERLSENALPAAVPPFAFDDFSAGFDAGWELDLFGKVRRGTQAAADDIQASEADYADVQRCLAAEVALTYIEVRTLQRRLEVVTRNLRSQTQGLEAVRMQLEEGDKSEFDVAIIERTVYQTAARQPEIMGQLQAAKNRLSVLLGEYPGLIDVRLGNAGQIPMFAGVVPVGHPAELLYRRPDVRRKERELAAASARIGVAVADYYPQVSLTGFITLESSNLSTLLDSQSLAFTAGPSVRWNVLNFGRIEGGVDVRRAQFDQAKSRYYGTVLAAAEEVQTSMSLYAQERKRVEYFAAAAAAADRAVEKLELRQQIDIDELDALNVVDAYREKVAVEDNLVVSQGLASANLVRLYKSLAGGWGTDHTLAAGDLIQQKLPPTGR